MRERKRDDDMLQPYAVDYIGNAYKQTDFLCTDNLSGSVKEIENTI